MLVFFRPTGWNSAVSGVEHAKRLNSSVHKKVEKAPYWETWTHRKLEFFHSKKVKRWRPGAGEGLQPPRDRAVTSKNELIAFSRQIKGESFAKKPKKDPITLIAKKWTRKLNYRNTSLYTYFSTSKLDSYSVRLRDWLMKACGNAKRPGL